jgi:putative oxidoreductase
MTIAQSMTRFSTAARSAVDRLTFLAPLATRVTIGLGFLHTGIGKWQHFDNIVQFFAGLGIPFPTVNAGLVATFEVVGGALLLVGLLTRPAAAVLSTVMVVALLTSDGGTFLASWGSASETSPTDVASWVFLLYLLWLIAYGAGPLSVDRLVRWLRDRAAES